jgi:hypothetical protein
MAKSTERKGAKKAAAAAQDPAAEQPKKRSWSKAAELELAVDVNDADSPNEGGRMIASTARVSPGELPTEITHAEILLQMRTDTDLEKYPHTKKQKIEKRLRIVVYTED